MSRRYSSSSTLTEICAFWAMVISGFASLSGAAFKFICDTVSNLSPTLSSAFTKVYNITMFVGQIALIIAVAIPAYQFVKYKAVAWKVIYWIGLVGFALCSVLGLISGLGIISITIG